MDNVVGFMPPMLIGEELTKALSVLPPYDPSIRDASTSERLIKLARLYDVYLPSPMTEEIYCKLYLALLRSLQKKQTRTATVQGIQYFSCKKGTFSHRLTNLLFFSVQKEPSHKGSTKIVDILALRRYHAQYQNNL